MIGTNGVLVHSICSLSKGHKCGSRVHRIFEIILTFGLENGYFATVISSEGCVVSVGLTHTQGRTGLIGW